MRERIVFAFIFCALLVVACNTKVPDDAEHLGTQQQAALLALGQPCDSNSQCSSGFCVDAVCCATTCHVGQHADNHACSDVYGCVSGSGTPPSSCAAPGTHIVATGQPGAGQTLAASGDPWPGTCIDLNNGDPCGEITNLNPCQWRGTTVNGGTNCPVPANGTSNACYTCDPNNCANPPSCGCPPGLPVCTLGGGGYGCGPCTSDAQCPSNFPVCITSGSQQGSCVQCAPGKTQACTGATSSCDFTTDTCVGCDGDFGSGTQFACPTLSNRVCLKAGVNTGSAGLPNGLCVQCQVDPNPAHVAGCTGSTATCDSSQDTCVQCVTSPQCSSTPSTPICGTDKTCHPCNGDQGSPSSLDCYQSNDPACVSGQCEQCSATDNAYCNTVNKTTSTGTQLCYVPAGGGTNTCVDCLSNADCTLMGFPFCDTANTHTCQANCMTNAQCASPTPACNGTHCVECTTNAQCPSVQHPNGVFCDTTNIFRLDTCIQCRDFHDCTNPAAPVCSQGNCVPCDGDNGSAVDAACPTTSLPACNPTGGPGACVQCTAEDPILCTGNTAVCNTTTNLCVQCTSGNPTACVGTTPICDNAAGNCVKCNGDFGSNAAFECTDPTNPACIATGACVQCSATNATRCTGSTPVCKTTTNRCVECLTNSDCKGLDGICNTATNTCTAGCSSDANCTTPGLPRCDVPTAQCVQCLGNTDCGGTKPFCNTATKQCVACLDSSTCPAATPVCENNACVACDGNNGSGSPGACPTTTNPACVAAGPDAGKCVQCTTADNILCTGATPACNDTSHTCVQCQSNTQCSGTKPICQLTPGTCVACDGDLGAGTPAACYSAADPACVMSGANAGACVECTPGDGRACVGSKPICDAPTNKCVQCETNADCSGTNGVCNTTLHVCTLGCTSDANCPMADPACKLPEGFCVQCTATNKTACVAPTPFCDLTTNACVGNCSKDSDCPMDKPKCDPGTKQCVGCVTSMDCTAPNPVCNGDTHTCGTTCTKSAECPKDTPVCDPVSHKCEGCATNADCPISAPICDSSAHTCGNTCSKNSDCPQDAPICNPQSHNCVGCVNDTDCPSTAPLCDGTTLKCVATPDDLSIEGGGCACSTVPTSNGRAALGILVSLGLAASAVKRRRSRQQR